MKSKPQEETIVDIEIENKAAIQKSIEQKGSTEESEQPSTVFRSWKQKHVTCHPCRSIDELDEELGRDEWKII